MNSTQIVIETEEKTVHPLFRLGRPYRLIDTRTFKLARLLPKALPPITYPFDVDSQYLFMNDNNMYGNDVLGDCVIAARAHHTLRLEAFEQKSLLSIAVSDVTSEYFKETGGADSGLNMTTSLNEWRQSGWTVSGKTYTIYAYAAIDLQNKLEVEAALFLFNGIYAGVTLPISAQSQTGVGKIWDVDNTPNGTPGSWGGHCFTGDTKIPLLNGTTLTLKELAENYADKEFWVYSCDEFQNIVPGKGKLPKLTRKMAKILKVTLDNGESIRCTEDHLFLMRNGEYKEASKLQAFDSLMPLYRRNGKNDYEVLLNPRDQKEYFTKVASIEEAGFEDVYDFEVEKYHNFALSAGVFVHNCVYIVALNETGPVCITWGARQQMTWAFWFKYFDEAFAVIDNIDPWVQNNPLNITALQALLQDVLAGPINPPAPEQNCLIHLSVSPANAIVSINGLLIPGQPTVFEIAPGSYTLTAVLKGYRTARQTITVAAGSTTLVPLILKKTGLCIFN
jgi:hypothetical protein